jgi:predicted O-linked N-acetylglucosamine transferase (SPINDLY family)
MTPLDQVINAAFALLEQGQPTKARCLLESSLADHPGAVRLHCLLGQTCARLGDTRTAMQQFRSACQMAPADPEPLLLLGVLYENLGHYREALAAFEQLRLLHPYLPLARRWIGLVLFRLGRLDDATACYQNALDQDPDYHEARIGLASLLIRQHRLDEAEPHLQQVLQSEPDNTTALNELSRVYRLQGEALQSSRLLEQALQLSPDSHLLASNLLYGLCDRPDLTPSERAERHIQLAQRLYPLPETRPPAPLLISANTKRHIAYLSGDFCTHAIISFLEPVLAHHDYQRFAVYCYANVALEDETTQRLKGYPVVWRSVYGMPAAAVAEQMRQDGIEILVELSGHTAGNRLDVCALKPAPVQVSWIGYPHSTGMRQIDYYLTDQLCDPAGVSEPFFSEQLYRLPRIFCCYLPPLEFPPVRERAAATALTFGCFNNFAKINEPLLELWIRILQQLPEARLMLKSHALGGVRLQERLRTRFAAHGIHPDRVVFKVYTRNVYDHLDCYNDIDIALDSYPYHGTTTTCEALWMGVPVITLAGDCHLARVGVSFLTAVGLEELIARSPEAYIAVAVSLTRDRLRLRKLRSSLRLMLASSPLMDASGVTRELEQAYGQMLTIAEQLTPGFQQQYLRASSLFQADRYADAISPLLQALALQPEHAGCSLMLASSLQATGRPDEALYHYRRLLRFGLQQLAGLGRQGSDAFGIAATAAYEAGREELARQLCEQALQLDPDNLIVRFRLCLYGLQLYRDNGEREQGRRHYVRELQLLTSLPLDRPEQLEQAIAAISELTPFFLAYQGEDDRPLQERYGAWLCRIMSRRYPQLSAELPLPPVADRKIRVGFVSAHFYNHSVWKIITRGWLEHLDRSRFTCFCYYAGSIDDQATQHARSLADQFQQSLRIDELVRSINDDRPDILIYPGIGMDTYVQQLAALRLAPVQCASWGHPVTTGIPTIDYFLSSDLMEPEEGEQQYSEQLVRLPNLSVCCTPARSVVGPLPAELQQLLPDTVRYLCCQNLHKYLPQHDDLFPAIAARVPRACFIFVNTHSAALQARFQERMDRSFRAAGLFANQHILILPRLAGPAYVALNEAIDIYLDNLEWSGGNTTLESLPFSKPIVTLPGRFMRGRHTTAMLRMMGVAGTIATTRAQYIELAVRLALDPVFYQRIATAIARNKGLLYHDSDCIKALEQFIIGCFTNSRNSLNPEGT